MRLKLALAAVAALALGGCGETWPEGTRSTTSTVTPAPPFAAPPCNPAPGHGTMGACQPPTPPGLLAPNFSGRVTFPDVSEYQSCPLYGPAIIRVYEAGTGRKDATADCHARELARLKAWVGVYFFARPYPGCTAEADRFVSIARSLPVHVNVYVIDAEVWLPHGFVSCVSRRVSADTGGAVVVTYTSTGTTSGGPIYDPLWLASYGALPGCIEGRCGRVAWQYSSTATCGHVYGDCSVDEGILSLGVKRPVDRGALKARIRTLHRELAAKGCNRRVRQHEPTGERCKRWKREGDERHRELGA